MNPFQEIVERSFLGQPLEGCACIQCGVLPNRFVAAALSDDDIEKATTVFAYALCERCQALFWEEANATFFRRMRKVFCGES